MQTVGLVLPTAWDRRQLEACAAAHRDRFEVVELGPDDDDVHAGFDGPAWVDAQAARWRGRLHGVFSSSDYPGATLAAALGRALGLPAPTPRAVLSAGHKLHSRTLQRRLTPAAVPAVHGVDPAAPTPWPWPGPAFCKPVRGSFSRHTAVVADFAALCVHLQRPAVADYRGGWLRPARRLQQAFAPELPPGDGFLCEELLAGQQVTVEGFCVGDAVHILGVVDSVRDPSSGSFTRFDYPSRLPGPAQQQLAQLAGHVALAHDLGPGAFNVELFWDPERRRAAIIEINARLCGQFADLYEKVDGVNSYELALAVATGGEPPRSRPGGWFAAAASVPLRVHAACRVVAAPGPAQLAGFAREHPAALLWSECAVGDELSDFASEDGQSLRYAVVNFGGPSADAVAATAATLPRRLGYAFAPLAPRPA